MPTDSADSKGIELRPTGPPPPDPLPRCAGEGENSIPSRRSCLPFSLPHAVCGGGLGRGARGRSPIPSTNLHPLPHPNLPQFFGGGGPVVPAGGGAAGRERLSLSIKPCHSRTPALPYGASTTASPSITCVPSCCGRSCVRRTRRLGMTSATSTRAVTVSPIFTGPVKRRLCDR